MASWPSGAKQQSLAWMWERIDAGLKQHFSKTRRCSALLPQLLKDVSEGRRGGSTAARNLLASAKLA